MERFTSLIPTNLIPSFGGLAGSPVALLLVIMAVITMALVASSYFRQIKCHVPKVEAVSKAYDWRIRIPEKFRPMKPVYHMVMNIGKITPDNWLYIDSDYEWVTKTHKEILEAHPNETCKANASAETAGAVEELYDLVFGVLAQQYPQYFVARGKTITNTILNKKIPRYGTGSKLPSEQLLRILMENTEEDFQLLQHDPKSDEFVVRAIGGLTSDGYSWKKKLNRKLTDVHIPVPGYKEKLKNSMNRFFKKLEPNVFIQRFTWGIHIGSCDQIYYPVRKHVGSGEGGKFKESDIDFEKGVWLRVERQVPTKLPRSGFLILTQHTFWYPLTDLKNEGIGDLTATSIEAWPDVFAEYKGRPDWEEAIIPWLRR